MGPRSADFKLNHWAALLSITSPTTSCSSPSCRCYLGSWALSPSRCVALGHVYVYPHCDLILPSSSRTPRDTLPEPPQPALRRAAQALRVMVLPVSCLLFLPGPALHLPPKPHFSREAEMGGLGVLHPGTSGLRPAPVDRGSWTEGRMSWKSLQPVSRVPQDPSRAGVKPCPEGPGGADRAGQQGRGPPASALP